MKYVPNGLVLEHYNIKVFAIRVASAVRSRSFLWGVAKRKMFSATKITNKMHYID